METGPFPGKIHHPPGKVASLNRCCVAPLQTTLIDAQVLLEAGQGFVSVKEIQDEDGKPDLLFSMDRAKVKTVGKDAIGEFLKKLQVTLSVTFSHPLIDLKTLRSFSCVRSTSPLVTLSQPR